MNSNYWIYPLFLIITIFEVPINNTILDWKLVEEKEGIKVYTRNPSNSDFKEIRIKANFEGDIDSFLHKLNTPYSYTQWVYKCTEGKMLEQIDSQEFYYYTVSNMPFPVKDRDMVVRCKQWKDTKGIFYSSSTAAPNFIPNKKDLVRIPYFKSEWKITPLPDKEILVDYTALADPGGSLPAWIVNLAVTTGPLKTMQQLIKSVNCKLPK